MNRLLSFTLFLTASVLLSINSIAQNTSNHPLKINCNGISVATLKTTFNNSKIIAWTDSVVYVFDKYRTTTVYNYNKQGLLVSKTIVSTSENILYENDRYDYFYNNGLCVKIDKTSFLEYPQKLVKTTIYTYKNQLMDRAYVFYYEDNKEILYECKVFEYDTAKHLIYVGSYRDAKNKILSLVKQEDYIYDIYGRIASVIDNLIFMHRVDHLTYSYDSKNRINKMYDIGYKYASLTNIGDDFSFNYSKDDDGTTFSHNFTHSLKYDSDDHLVAVPRENEANRGVFTYDERGRLSHMTLNFSQNYDIYYGSNSRTPSNTYLIIPVVSHNSMGVTDNIISVFNPTKNIFVEY